MKKYRRVVFAMSLALLAAFSSAMAGATQERNTPEACVTAFYSWYIATDAGLIYPLTEKGIYRYVSREAVARLRSDYRHDRLPGGVDYFLKVQDFDEADWLAHIDVKAVVMLGDVAVVPVTFGTRDPSGIVAYLRKIGGRWLITKVDDTSDYR